jgi:hypothetical protein
MEGIVAGAILIFTLIAPTPKNQAVIAKSSAPVHALQANQTQVSPTTIPFKKYTVETGDTLDSISKKFYGSGKYWTTLWNDNDWIDNPTQIHKSWELKISNIKPEKVEDLAPILNKKYEELNPSPTITPVPTIEISSSSNSNLSAKPSSFDDIYKQAGTRFGVPWEILYGIHLTETGLRDGAIISGYGGGAQGPMQFLLQTFNSYAIDGNGDGVPDINNAVDAIFTAANYLAAHGGIEQGLKSYGGDMAGILSAARSRGYAQ